MAISKRRLVNQLIRDAKLSNGVFTDMVDTLKQQEAHGINHAGLRRQAGYLVDRIGLPQTRKTFDRLLAHHTELVALAAEAARECTMSLLQECVIEAKKAEAASIVCDSVLKQVEYLIDVHGYDYVSRLVKGKASVVRHDYDE